MTEFEILSGGIAVGFGVYCVLSLVGAHIRNLLKTFFK